MINEKKIRLMSEMSLYRETGGKETIKYGKYIEENRKFGIFFRNIPFGIIAFAVLAVLIFITFPEFLAAAFEYLGTFLSVAAVIVLLIVFLIIYSLYAGYMAGLKFKRLKGGFWRYQLGEAGLNNIIRAEEVSFRVKR